MRGADGVGAALALAAVCMAAASTVRAERAFRVCADPNNLPFSNAAGEGFENALAEVLAAELGATVEYTWWAQRRGFIRNTLNAGACDVVMGVPAGYELVATTRPYYRSTYVFVYRPRPGFELRAIDDPRLRDLRIGVHLVGDDGANTPPVHALGKLGIVDNVQGFMIYGDYREPDPPARLIAAVRDGEIDVAAVWGPIGGYFARVSEPPLEAVPIERPPPELAPYRFEFSIAVGVRRDDEALREALDAALERRSDDVQALLAAYGVPLLPPSASQVSGARDGGEPGP